MLSLVGDITSTVIDIIGNLCLRIANPQRAPFAGYMQGIDSFDGDLHNFNIVGNKVISSACHGVSFYSLHDSTIANNAVIDDGSGAAGQCALWLGLFKTSHQGAASSNVSIINNAASAYNIDETIVGLTKSGNTCIPGADLRRCLAVVARTRR